MTKTAEARWENGGCLPVPLGSVWITGACSLRCKHCYDAHGAGNRRHLPKKDVLLTLDRLAPFVNSVSFMGGEPTLHPDLPELCDHARNALGKYVLLVSNGVTFPDRLIDELEGKIDCIKIGMDGVTAECHDAVRGAGSFAAAMKTWEKLPSRIPTMCKFTLNAQNVRELPLIADFYRALGAKRLEIVGPPVAAAEIGVT